MTVRKTAVGLLAGTTLASPTLADEVEVIHWLVTGSESAAIQHLADGVEARGTTWIELVPPDGGAAADALFNSRLSGGNPPGAMFASIGREAIDLGAAGILRDIRALVDSEGLVETVPDFAIDIVSGDGGELYAIPIAFETQNFMWYSTEAFETAGLEPPEDWETFLSQAPQLQEAGIIPIAVGGQGWQINQLFFPILISQIGADQFLMLYGDQDEAAARSEGVTETFRILRELSTYADAGSPNRSWNDTLGLVADDRAAINVMGSWAGGELAAMGVEYGSEWGCAIAGGDTWIVGATGFMITDLGEESPGQDDFIRAVLDPEVQTAFSVEKGSIPTRTDASTEGLSECSRMVSEGIADGRGVPHPNALISADAVGQIEDMLANFWVDTSVTPEAAAEMFADIIINDF